MLDPNLPTPLYLQIRDTLRSEILEKPYHEGDPFFSESDLLARFSVARGTVRQALANEIQHGILDLGAPHVVRAAAAGGILVGSRLAAAVIVVLA